VLKSSDKGTGGTGEIDHGRTGKGLSISLTGPAREAALRDFRRQIGKWKVALPPAECLVADFGLGDFRKVGLIESWIANDAKAGYCGKYLFVFDGQTCPMHRHRTKHETFFIVKGKVRMRYAGGSRVMREAMSCPSASGSTTASRASAPRSCRSFNGLQGRRQLLREPEHPIGGNYRGSRHRRDGAEAGRERGSRGGRC